jgi:tetratricopeptide (TPR) repeat protein
MKAKYYIVIFLITILCGASTYQYRLDSLKNRLSKETNLVQKATLLNRIAEEYQDVNPEKMLEYAEKALHIAKHSGNKLQIGYGYLNLGNANIILGNYDVALECFHNAKNILESNQTKNSSIDFKNALAKSYGSIGVVFSEKSNYSKALEFYRKSMKVYQTTGKLENVGVLLNNIGIIYLSKGQENKALTNFKKSLEIQKKFKDPSMGITLTNIGNIYNHKGQLKKAEWYYIKAKNIFLKFSNPRGLGELYNNLGLLNVKKKAFPKAKMYLNLAIKEFSSINDKFGISDTYIYLGDIEFEQQIWDQALLFYYKSLFLSKELGILDQIKNTEYKLYQVYEKKNNEKEALTHYIQFSESKDSILSEANIRNTIQAEMNYEFDKKELYYKKEQEKKEFIYQEKIKDNKQIFIFVVVAVLLAFSFSIVLYYRNQKHKTTSLKLELVEYEQKALHLQMNPHFVFNCLGSISSFIIQNNTDQAIKYLSKFSKLMRLTLEFSKVPLIPIDKEIESLENYLALEQLRFNQGFKYSISKSEEIEDDVALPSLLLQPFVENAIIHGVVPKKGSGIIQIQFDIDEDHLICRISDNGVGIYESQKEKKKLVNVHKSMALKITENRLKMMETILKKSTSLAISELKNEVGKIEGTSILVKIPIQYLEKN